MRQLSCRQKEVYKSFKAARQRQVFVVITLINAITTRETTTINKCNISSTPTVAQSRALTPQIQQGGVFTLRKGKSTPNETNTK